MKRQGLKLIAFSSPVLSWTLMDSHKVLLHAFLYADKFGNHYISCIHTQLL